MARGKHKVMSVLKRWVMLRHTRNNLEEGRPDAEEKEYHFRRESL